MSLLLTVLPLLNTRAYNRPISNWWINQAFWRLINRLIARLIAIININFGESVALLVARRTNNRNRNNNCGFEAYTKVCLLYTSDAADE